MNFPPYAPSVPDWMRQVSRGLNQALGRVFDGGAMVGTQGNAEYGFLLTNQVTPGTDQHFLFGSKVFSGARTDTGSEPGNNHCVAVYGEAQRGAGSSDGVWGLNTVTEAFNLNGPTIGYEVDLNNFSGSDPGLSPAHDFNGIQVVSGAAGRGGTAYVCERNGGYSNNEWNRGWWVKDVKLRAIEFTNCGTATGLFSDTTVKVEALAAADVLKLKPFNSSGVLVYGVNSADSSILFRFDQNSTAAETNMMLSVAGAASVRVSVGASDSGGAGYRLLRVPN